MDIDTVNADPAELAKFSQFAHGLAVRDAIAIFWKKFAARRPEELPRQDKPNSRSTLTYPFTQA